MTDILTLVISTAPLTLAVIGGFAWTINRQDRLHGENQRFITTQLGEIRDRLTRLEAAALGTDHWRRGHV